MASIFIWKTASEETDAKSSHPCSMIRYYRGTDWFLEEHGGKEEVSYSYQLLSQKQEDSYLYFSAKQMETDWTGSDLLECIEVPYRLYKLCGGWRWEQLGEWNRCICSDTGRPIEEQWRDVCKWIRGDSPVPSVSVPSAPVPSVSVPSAPVPAYSDRSRDRYTGAATGAGMNRGRGGYRGRDGGRGRDGYRGRGGGRGRDGYRGNIGV